MMKSVSVLVAVMCLTSLTIGTPCDRDPITVEYDEVAEGRPTFQSSTNTYQDNYAPDGDAYKAVDGNTDGHYLDGSCTHTLRDVDAWWAVDLGQQRNVHHVGVFNRLDCCHDRLKDFHVGVTNQSPATTTPVIGGYTDCGFRQGTFEDSIAVYCNPVRRGRYVIIQLENGNTFLTLCEVKVFTEQ